jgi:hypothetical protein
MRMLRFLLTYVLLNIFALLAATFLAQNYHSEHLTFFGVTITINFVFVLIAAVIFGFLAALLLILPGRIAAHLHSWTLDHEAEELEQQVDLLQEQREEMLSQLSAMMTTQEQVLSRYQRLLAEHNQVVAELEKAKAVVMAPGTVVTALPAAQASKQTAAASAPARTATAVAAPQTAAPARTAPAVAASARTAAAVPARTAADQLKATTRNPVVQTTRDWTARIFTDTAKTRLSKTMARLLPEPALPLKSRASSESQAPLLESEIDAPDA